MNNNNCYYNINGFLKCNIVEGFDNNEKTISLCIPCIPKHVKFLSDLSKNINEQTIQPDEIVIAISNSTNEIEKNIKNIFKNLNTKLVITGVSKTAYAGENRNRAVEYSSSDIISFIDADDLMHPQRIEILKYHFNKSNCLAILHKYTQKDIWNNINKKNTNLDSDILKKYHKDKTKIFLKIDHMTHGHITVKKKVFDKIKQETRNTRKEDSQFVRDLMNNFDQNKIYFLNESLSKYRQELSSKNN